jgi:hypothetical protein
MISLILAYLGMRSDILALQKKKRNIDTTDSMLQPE